MPLFRVAATSDHHAPITDKRLFEQAFEIIKAHDPQVYVMVGDWLEAKRASRHNPDSRHNWNPVDEMREVARQVQYINDAIPNAYKVFLFGNHDANLLSYTPDHMQSGDAETFQALWQALVEPHMTDWRVIDRYSHEQTWSLGQFTFRHGAEVSDAAYKQDLFDYCVPNGLLIQGHTHRPQRVEQLIVGKAVTDRWGCNLGALMDVEKAYYMDRKRKSLWGAGVFLGEVSAPGLKEGRVFSAKKNWEGDVHIICRYGQNWKSNKAFTCGV